ncbi:sulfotransferase 1C4-like [Glandiceps talaboti]
MASKNGPRKPTIPLEIHSDFAVPVCLYNNFPLLGLTNRKVIDKVLDVELRDDDVFIVGYPKSGTNWLQVLLTDICNSWGTLQGGNHRRVPLLEVPTRAELAGMDQFVTAQSPRLVKSHLPYHLFPRQRLGSGCKVIYIARNPKDLCVSYFHMLKGFRFLTDADWNDHFIRFLKGKMWYGNWLDHVTGWLNHVQDDNVLVVYYENLKKDLAAGIRQLADFIGHPLTGSDSERLAESGQFNNMKKTANTQVNIGQHFDHKSSPFFRKGIVGDWKNIFTVTQNDMFENILVSKMKAKDLEMVYDM